MKTKSYNGWTNYETWAVNLWLDNDEGSQSYWAEQATEALKRVRGDRDDIARGFADSIKEQHEEVLPELTGFAADLLNAAMSEVNWHEIATTLLDSAEEETNA